MKFRISFKWSILTLSLILNLHCDQCIADNNSRSRKSVQLKNIETISDDYGDSIDDTDEQNNYLDDYEDTDVDKRYATLENNEQNVDNNDNLIPESKKIIGRIAKREVDFELAKFELKKVEKNVENEILNLDKLYKTGKQDNKRKTIKIDKIPSSQKVEIHIERNDNGNEPVKNNFNLKEQEEKSGSSLTTRSLNLKKNSSLIIVARSEKEFPLTSNEKKIENAIQTKIDAIKIEVKRQIKAELQREMIKKMNEKYDELQRIYRSNTQSKNYNELVKSSINNGVNLENKDVHKRSTWNNKKNKLTKLITKNINHREMKKIKKSIHKPDKIFVHVGNKSFPDVRIQDQLTILKSKRADSRFKRRFRNPPGDAKIQSRSSRRLRKPSGIEFSSLKNSTNNYNRNDRHAINLKNSTTNSNFLFRQNSQRKRSAVLSNHVKQLALSQNKHEKSLKTKHNRQLREQKRALDNLFDETNSNTVVNSNDLANTKKLQDSHLLSGYEEMFGDFNKDNRDDTSLMRYKRVKRS